MKNNSIMCHYALAQSYENAIIKEVKRISCLSQFGYSESSNILDSYSTALLNEIEFLLKEIRVFDIPIVIMIRTLIVKLIQIKELGIHFNPQQLSNIYDLYLTHIHYCDDDIVLANMLKHLKDHSYDVSKYSETKYAYKKKNNTIHNS